MRRLRSFVSNSERQSIPSNLSKGRSTDQHRRRPPERTADEVRSRLRNWRPERQRHMADAWVLRQLQARGAFVLLFQRMTTPAYCVVDLARCVIPQAQRKPDLENAVEDRVDADDVEQRQRAGPGLDHQNQSEDDR